MNDVLVSICCITYNHEKYLRDALESFLMQKTDFVYEIIIRDDASTDNTANIIREYEQKYPNIVKPIYEKENGYKKGIEPISVTLKKAKGKYIALCEGDDYWIDEQKLQKQVEYMEGHNNCTLCFHNAEMLFMKSKKKEIYIDKRAAYKRYINSDGIYTASNIHLIRFGGSIPTASFMFRSKYAKNFPDFYFKCPCSDMPLKLIMTSYGYAYYMDDVMSVYRRETGTSVTDNWKNEQNTNEKIERHVNKMINTINDFDKFTKYQYTDGLKISKKYYELQSLLAQGKNREILKSEYKEYYKIQNKDQLCIKLLIKIYVPQLYKRYKKIMKN